MARTTWIAAGLLALAGSSAALSSALSRSTPSDAAPRAVAAAVRSTAPARPARSGTLLLTVEVATGGIDVLQVVARPALEFRSPRHADRMPFGWRVVDAGGNELATGGFDPSRICLDPAHAGQPPHVDGDFLEPHVAHTNVKIPDLDGATTVEFLRRTEDGRSVPFGAVDLATARTRRVR